jgi:MFS transporter, DHA1 family, inner membrane transport protein
VAPAIPRSNWPAVWIIFAGGLAAGAHMTKVPPALPVMRAEFMLTLVESGFLQTMMYAVGATVGVLGGALADRFGQKRFALIGLALMAAGGLFGALAGSYVMLLASRSLEGLGFILFTVSAVPLLVAATLPRDRATALSLWSCYMPTGGTIALLCAPFALATLGWRSLWLGLAGYAAICAAMLVRHVEAPPFGGNIGSRRLIGESLRRPGILALCLAFICYTGQWTSLMTWLPTFVVDERGMSPATASLLTAVFVATNIPGNLLGGVLLKHGMARGVVMAGGAGAMGLTALGFLAGGAPDELRLACALMFSLLGGVIPGAVFSATPVHAKSSEHIGTTNGMIMQASHFAQFAVPIAVAWMASHFGGWSASLNTMLILSGAGAAAGLAAGHYERRLEARAPAPAS